AGNYDDGQLANGALLTMGGDNDNFSTLLPSYADDHEKYNLVPYITTGDTSITINTNNPTNDDDIFLATFWTSGEGTISVETPEPLSIALLGMGLAGIGLARRRKNKI
ncbi:MAG: PEP-CTERM sorting domain-containing protein, partial [Gammaproteobacteria bacterium]|nr:PEP-CTERM sorting domain-containing protein [Gammaproteobacteria bacterium]